VTNILPQLPPPPPLPLLLLLLLYYCCCCYYYTTATTTILLQPPPPLLPDVAEWLKLPLFIWDVLGSNLSPETGYPDSGFRGFSQSLQAYAGIVP
jgi:hypothetical protein